MSKQQQMLKDAETLTADAFKTKYGIHEGQDLGIATQPVQKTRPKLEQAPCRDATADEETAIAQAGLQFFNSYPYIARGDVYGASNYKVIEEWFLENNAMPTKVSFDTCLEEIAHLLTFQVGERIITPDEIAELDADTFKLITKRQAVAAQDTTLPLEHLSAAEIKTHIQELEAEESIRDEGTLVALVEKLPRGTEAGDEARAELIAVRKARREDLTNIPAVVIGQRSRLVNTVIEARPYLLDGFSREEVEDLLLTQLELYGITWSLQSLNAAADELSATGKLPRNSVRQVAGVRVVENPRFAAPVPDREVEIVERTQKLTRAQVDAMSADEYKASLRNPEFVRALNNL